MDITPAVAESVRVITAHLESFGGGVLQDRDGIVATLEQKFDGLGAQLRGVEAIEHDRPSSSLSVTDLPGEDRFTSRVPAPVELEIAVPDHRYQLVSQCFGRTAQGDVTGRIGGPGFRPEFVPLFVDDAFTADNDDVLLQIVEMLYAFDQVLDIQRMFRHQNDVRTSVGRSERDITGMPAHDLDDGDATMALRGCPDPFDAAG